MICPKCNTSLLQDDTFCSSCGFKIPAVLSQQSEKGSFVDPVTNQKIIRLEEPQHYFSHNPAPLGKRFAAFVIDISITLLLIPVAGLGIIYFLFKDGFREGRSFGKNLLNLRVINYDTYLPAKFSDSFGRNLGLIFGFTLFFQSEHRHLSDVTAGTMVIDDTV